MTVEKSREGVRPSVERRISDLKRERDSIRRVLEQASLKRVKREVERQTKTIDAVDKELRGEA